MTSPACLRCSRDTVTIHARGLCSLCYSLHRDDYARTKFQRPYTAREREIIRRDWGRRSCREIAQELGRMPRDVYSAAVRFGVTKPRHVLKTDPKLHRRLVRLHAKGYSDREIGRIVGFGHGTVARWLRRMGLPSNCRTRPTDPFPERTRRKLSQIKRHQIKTIGLIDAVPFLRKHAHERAQAIRMGWPQANTLREARILDHCQQHGPSTLIAIAGGLGARKSWLGQVVRSLVRNGALTRPGRSGRYMLYALPDTERRFK